ncbi:MAG: 30S ribosomal protein S9 [Bacteroidetes bacterium]|nr:30S ribosomal protein S9 [Bacteroidota bacterium]
MSQVFNAVGRRKTAVARVRIVAGSGKVMVNKREFNDYFPTDILRMAAVKPLATTQLDGKYDVMVNVHGGGLTGQAGAVSLGIARCLLLAEEGVREPLKREGLLTRDSRMVERKKPGRPKARKRFQFSKR